MMTNSFILTEAIQQAFLEKRLTSEELAYSYEQATRKRKAPDFELY